MNSGNAVAAHALSLVLISVENEAESTLIIDCGQVQPCDTNSSSLQRERAMVMACCPILELLHQGFALVAFLQLPQHRSIHGGVAGRTRQQSGD